MSFLLLRARRKIVPLLPLGVLGGLGAKREEKIEFVIIIHNFVNIIILLPSTLPCFMGCNWLFCLPITTDLPIDLFFKIHFCNEI